MSRSVGHDGLFVALASVVHEQVNQDEARCQFTSDSVGEIPVVA